MPEYWKVEGLSFIGTHHFRRWIKFGLFKTDDAYSTIFNPFYSVVLTRQIEVALSFGSRPSFGGTPICGSTFS